MGEVLAKHTGVMLDRAGRVQVEPDLTIPGHPEIFVIGDLAHCAHQDGKRLPGLAAVAMQQGRYVGGLISQRLREKDLRPLRYHDKGNVAIIGRHAGVVDFGRLHLHGFLAWIL